MGTIPATPTFTSGQVLTAAELTEITDAIDFWANPPRCFAYDSSGVSMTSGALTTITLDAELFDVVQSGDTAAHDLSTNNDRIYIRTAGTYEISGQTQIPYNATGYRYAVIYINGTTQIGRNTQDPVSGGQSTSCAIPPVEATLSVGDYITMSAFQNSGGSLTTVTGRQNTWLRVRLVGS